MRGSNRGFNTAPGAGEPDPADGVARSVTGSSGAVSGGAATGPATAEDVQALIESLSTLRLSLSTDLSAAAGAMDAGHPEVAADLVAGTRVDLAHLRDSVLRREQEASEKELVSAGVGDRSAGRGGGIPDADSPGSPKANEPRGRIPAPLRRPGRILVGVALLGVTLLMAPHLSGDSGSSGGSGGSGRGSAGAAAGSQSPQIRLASAEFAALQSTLRSPHATPAAVLEAGKRWQRAVSQSLSAASTHVDTASELVLLLRQERTLISDASVQTPALHEATQTLAGGSDTLLNTLRGMADGPVLETLPTTITVLPSQPSGVTTTPVTTPGTTTPDAGGSASPAPVPTTGTPSTPTSTQAPTTPAEPTPPVQSPPPQTPSPATPTPSPSLPQATLPQLQIPQALASAGGGGSALTSAGSHGSATLAPSTDTGSAS